MHDIEKKRSIQQNYNDSAIYYDARYLKIQFQKLLILFSRIKSLNSPMLDMGTGTGILWEFILSTNFLENKRISLIDNKDEWIDQQYELLIKDQDEQAPPIQMIHQKYEDYFPLKFVGIDISHEMLKIFYYRTKKEHSYNLSPKKINTNLVCADGEHLPFRNGCFNSIISLTALQNLADPKIGIAELHRVSSEDVLMGISFLKKRMTKSEFLQEMNKYWRDFHLISTFDSENQIEIEDWIGIN